MADRTGIMLCYPFEERRLAKWKPPYILQPKLDGERCRAIVDSEGRATLLSSSEAIIESVPHVNKAIESYHLRSVELDGELYLHGAPFEFIESVVSRTVNIHSDHHLIEYHAFDIVSTDIQAIRSSNLINMLERKYTGRNFGTVQIVPARVVETLDEIMRALEEYKSAGYEGFVIREAGAPYVRKRSTMMMKFKPRKEDLYEIVGWMEEISISGVPKNSMGALICGSDYGKPRLYSWSGKLPDGYFSVGSGSLLTRGNRQTLWNTRENLAGKAARVKYQHLTHGRGVPRFPVIVEIVDPLVKI